MSPSPFQTRGDSIVIDRSAAEALVSEAQGEMRARQQQIASEFLGQDAGTPGQGPAPGLTYIPGGGVLADRFLHPAFQIFEREYRRLPDEGFYSPNLSLSKPFTFELGTYTVPKNTALWLMDYQFDVYRPSGIDPGDFVRLEPGRFSNLLGFDLNITSGIRKSNVGYQLDPAPLTLGSTEFIPVAGDLSEAGGAENLFRSTRTRNTVSTIGSGLLPLREDVQGARGTPFTWVVGEGATVRVSCQVFGQLTSPISAISGRIAGFLLQSNLSSSLINRLRPR